VIPFAQGELEEIQVHLVDGAYQIEFKLQNAQLFGLALNLERQLPAKTG